MKSKNALEINESRGNGVPSNITERGFLNAIIVDLEKQKMTASDLKAIINKACEEKRPVIVEDISQLFLPNKNKAKSPNKQRN